MKFCGHRNPKTISGHYLDDMSNVDGVAVYLGLEQRQDITQDFRSASIKRTPDLQQSLPAKEQDELRQCRDFVDLYKQIDAVLPVVYCIVVRSTYFSHFSLKRTVPYSFFIR